MNTRKHHTRVIRSFFGIAACHVVMALLFARILYGNPTLRVDLLIGVGFFSFMAGYFICLGVVASRFRQEFRDVLEPSDEQPF